LGWERRSVSKYVLIDEIHAEVWVSRELSASAHKAIIRRLKDRRFGTTLRQIIREHFQRYPALRQLRLKITR
jgi:hypothetical protein